MRSRTTSTRGRGSAARTDRRRRSAAARRHCGSRRSPWAAPVPELNDLCRTAVEAAESDEAVEAYAEESRRTEASALRGQVEGLEFSESRGVGVRVIRDGRLGYAWAADPDHDEVREAVRRARENAALAAPDEHNVLPEPASWTPIPELFREESAAIGPDEKTGLALALEHRAISRDPRVTKIDEAQVGDAVSRVAIASTTGVTAEYARTDAWCLAVTLAVEGEETQTGFSYRIARGLPELDWEAVADEAVHRGVRMLGAVKPPTARVPIVLDTFDDEGVPSGRTELFTKGVLNGFLHNTYTAHKGGTASTGNGKRGYRSPPAVGTSNFYLDAGETPVEGLLREAEGGVLIQDVSGVHSGANPISGEFSVGATGLRITDGALGEPLREMTIASTLPEMLAAIAGVGDDLRFFSSVGTPSVLIGEMTLAGV